MHNQSNVGIKYELWSIQRPPSSKWIEEKMRSGLVTRCNKGKRILRVRGQRERHKEMTASEFFYQMRRELRLSLSQFQFNILPMLKFQSPCNSIGYNSVLHVFSIHHMIKGWIKSCITRWAMYWPQAKSVFCRHKKSAEL